MRVQKPLTYPDYSEYTPPYTLRLGKKGRELKPQQAGFLRLSPRNKRLGV